MPDQIIRGGMAVTPEGILSADIAIEDGRITAIAPELPGSAQDIDARGLHILPGLIDVHLHFNEPGRTEWEGAATGSAALAAGGGTLFFDMPLNSTPCTLNAREFQAKHTALVHSSITDFALWGGLVPQSLPALEELAVQGAIGFKAFLCDSGLPEFPRADDWTIYQGMRIAAQLELPVAVHAESEEITRGARQQLLTAGRHQISDYLSSRPVIAELEAIQRATLLAHETGAKLHIVHISSGRGVALAAEARAKGVDVTIETCPHYLFFTEDDLYRLGAVAKCAPPLRPAADKAHLWTELLAGHVDIVASDHSPAPADLKRDSNFFRVWGGIAGVQSTLAVLLEAGHHQRGLSLERIASLTAAHPAKRFRIANKGAIAIGNDADFALVDLAASTTLTSGDLHQRHASSPYLDAHFRGAVRRTIRRGETIFADGKPLARTKGKLIRPTI